MPAEMPALLLPSIGVGSVVITGPGVSAQGTYGTYGTYRTYRTYRAYRAYGNGSQSLPAVADDTWGW